MFFVVCLFVCFCESFIFQASRNSSTRAQLTKMSLPVKDKAGRTYCEPMHEPVALNPHTCSPSPPDFTWKQNRLAPRFECCCTQLHAGLCVSVPQSPAMPQLLGSFSLSCMSPFLSFPGIQHHISPFEFSSFPCLITETDFTGRPS